MEVITTREIVRETKTNFELAEKERVAVKREKNCLAYERRSYRVHCRISRSVKGR
ncbi:MAG: hypothetical protein U2P89_14000 [Proteiniphilum sp.]|uniref:hypothetical protein n=1 Tax=Proteiniphilum sp. TaxID=1926877 RepID=UPI002AB843C3|nr:hypothetical protein [Proteiniphilum sp.]MDY9919959.1 hypothetical protein [Proteiniphilum sp.]